MVYTEKRCWVCNAVIIWGQSDTACKVQCRKLLYAESYRIERHKEESYRKNRPCRLQLGEWAETLYVRYHQSPLLQRRLAHPDTPSPSKGPFESLDHFVPVSQGGATWVGNVVPACLQCQIAKGGLLPQEVEAIPQDVIERIARYLQRRAQSSPKQRK